MTTNTTPAWLFKHTEQLNTGQEVEYDREGDTLEILFAKGSGRSVTIQFDTDCLCAATVTSGSVKEQDWHLWRCWPWYSVFHSRVTFGTTLLFRNSPCAIFVVTKVVAFQLTTLLFTNPDRYTAIFINACYAADILMKAAYVLYSGLADTHAAQYSLYSNYRRFSASYSSESWIPYRNVRGNYAYFTRKAGIAVPFRTVKNARFFSCPCWECGIKCG